MGDAPKSVWAMGEKAANELSVELVQALLNKEGGRWFLRFLIDRPEGISINDCERFSRSVEQLLDKEDPIPYHYILEVSSAGLDRPLLRESDYERFRGRRIEIRLAAPVEGQRKYSGVLADVKQDGGRTTMTLILDNGNTLAVAYDQIARAKLDPFF